MVKGGGNDIKNALHSVQLSLALHMHDDRVDPRDCCLIQTKPELD